MSNKERDYVIMQSQEEKQKTVGKVKEIKGKLQRVWKWSKGIDRRNNKRNRVRR